LELRNVNGVGDQRKRHTAVTVIIAMVIALLPTTALFNASPARADALVASLELNANPHDIVIDAAGVYAYATTCDYGGIPGRIVRINLANFTIDDSLALSSDCARAVQIVDDTIYVTTSDRFYRFNAGTFGASTDDSIAIDDFGNGLAVSGSFAYITHHAGTSSDKVSEVNISGPTLVQESSFSSGGNWPMGIAIEPSGDFGYVVNAHSDSLAKIRLSNGAVVATIPTGKQSYGISIDPAGEYAYIPAAMPDAGQSSPWLVRVDLATFTWDDTVNLPFEWGFDVALTPDGAFAYVGESRSGNPGRIAKISLGANMSLAETITSNPGSHSLAVDPTGTYVYSADYNDHNQTTISKITVTGGAPAVTGLSVATGPIAGGETTVISGRNLTGATAVSFGATAATILSGTDDTIAVTVPAASSAGTVNVTVTTPMGTSGQTLTYTYTDPAPAPSPVIPPSAPGTPMAIPGNRSAVVTWATPASSGSFPVSTYSIRATPGGRVCVTTSTSCEITGLEPGMQYTFTVRALSGAGWSVESAQSNTITPTTGTITISGERKGKRLYVTGVTSGLQADARLTPWSSRPGRLAIRGQEIEVRSDGTFAWSRRASAKATWHIRVTGGNGVRSNTLVFNGSSGGR
jgi:DNA-binding beta-propeller fold protein YncE